MLSPREILSVFLLPSLIAAAGFLIGWWPRRKHRDGRWIGAIAVTAAFLAADTAVAGTPPWPPGSGDAAYWIIWFAFPTALLGLLDAIFHPPTWLRAGALFILARLAAQLLLAPLVPHNDPDALKTIWSLQTTIDAVALIAVTNWLTCEALAEKIPGSFVPILLTIFLAAATADLALSNNIKPFEAMAAMTAVAAIAATLSFFLPISLTRGAILAFLLPLLGLLLFVHFYSYTEPPLASIFLLLSAPLLAFTGDLPAIRVWKPKWRWTMRLAPVVVALALSAVLTARQFLAPDIDQSSPTSNPQDL